MRSGLPRLHPKFPSNCIKQEVQRPNVLKSGTRRTAENRRVSAQRREPMVNFIFSLRYARPRSPLDLIWPERGLLNVIFNFMIYEVVRGITGVLRLTGYIVEKQCLLEFGRCTSPFLLRGLVDK